MTATRVVVALGVLFLLTLPAKAGAAVYSSTGEITVPGLGPATPYPSTVDVAGVRGPVTSVSVTLRGLGHKTPTDMDIFLYSPTGKAVVLMSDVCGQTLVDATFTFVADENAPLMGASSCAGSRYRPTNGLTGGPDSGNVTNTDLATFVGDDPNGQWLLYVVDDEAAGGTGKIKSWSLDIEVQPASVLVPGVGTAGVADPYPATRTVSGETGVITDLDVVPLGVTHTRPDDLDVLLVGPHGEKALVLSDACGSDAIKLVDFDLDDEASAGLPAATAGVPCKSGSFRPTDHEPDDTLAAPAPPGPYSTSLSAFDLTDPNGEWKLYISDDKTFFDGFLAGSAGPFALQITTRPKAVLAFGVATVEAPEGVPASVRLVRSGPDALGAATVQLSTAPASATGGADFEEVSTLVSFAPGETEKMVPVLALPDAAPEAEESFLLKLGDTTGDARLDSSATAVVTIPAQPGTAGGAGEEPGGAGQTPPPRPTCVGKPATIVGTPGRDVLRGTKGSDVIVALGGNDRIAATSGNDIVCAGAGNDTVSGGSGSDRLFGEAGADRLSGGTGRDRLTGGSGRDTCTGLARGDKAKCERRRRA